ncbi:RES domain-containing protein [Sanguibacter suaedae]|uniref:RES domain-containing protein n=1 Tax=Sanguibacter suaedae TaxID=2795737 RepID=A0A934IC53_9MICO|nr:RES domain-containing protein [Sanguibacter suaedae]MBI9115672.1 RES domain-containing protein [Sanguibacter suaedae]
MSGVARTGSTQQPPDPRTDLTRFPQRTVTKGTQWCREHGPQGPWYFAAGPGGRFNLDEPHGTLYLANRPEAAARERIGPDHVQHGAIPRAIVENRWVSTLPLAETVSAAHVTHESAPSFRVVPELTTMRPYDTPRAWARAFFAAGFTGIWGMLRHSSATCRGLSVFGPVGTRDWPRDPTPVPLRALLDEMPGLTVVDPPHTSDLEILRPPDRA